MSDMTTHLDTIQPNSSQKEVVANALLDAASPAIALGMHDRTTTGLTWGYYGGVFVAGSPTMPTLIANGTILLTANATNYIEFNTVTHVVSKNTTGFTSGRVPMAVVTTGSAQITNFVEARMLQFVTMP